MRITEGQLRRIIRRELLREAAMTPSTAAGMGLRFEVSKKNDFADIRAFRGDWAVGSLGSTETGNPCDGAWQIYWANTIIDGLGPLLYDLMIDVIHPRPLTADRTSVSADAKRIWDFYHERRFDMEEVQLDDLRNTLTTTTRDNCEQWSAMSWGDGADWVPSSLSKGYRREGGGTPVLDELQRLGLVRFV
jgi:hypothetical protein